MTIKQLRGLKPGTKVVWVQDGADATIGTVRVADARLKKSARWIEWQDHQRTEDYDDWALVHVGVAQ